MITIGKIKRFGLGKVILIVIICTMLISGCVTSTKKETASSNKGNGLFPYGGNERVEAQLLKTHKNYKDDIEGASKAAGFDIKVPDSSIIGEEMKYLIVYESSQGNQKAALSYPSISISEEKAELPTENYYEWYVEHWNQERREYLKKVENELKIDTEGNEGYYYLVEVNGCKGVARPSGRNYSLVEGKDIGPFPSSLEWWEDGVFYSMMPTHEDTKVTVPELIKIAESLKY